MKCMTARFVRRHRRSGFTMVELLVVMGIIVLLMSITLAAVNFNQRNDRVRKGASQVQSFLNGARDRAIYRREPVGVRFFLDQQPATITAVAPSAAIHLRTVSTLAYLGDGGTWPSPEAFPQLVSLERRDLNNDGDVQDAGEERVVVVRGFNNPGWWNLKRRGWLLNGMRIRIPASPPGNWYPIDTSLIDVSVPPTMEQILLLQIPYADGGQPGPIAHFLNKNYEIELPWRLLPEEPSILPEGVVIDLDASRLPSAWRVAALGNLRYSGYMDIMFSPRGSVIGDAAAAGILHLSLGDLEDSRFLKEQFGIGSVDTLVDAGIAFVPMDVVDLSGGGQHISKDRRVVSVFTQTGDIQISHLNAFKESPVDADPDANGVANDPYRFAETGEAAP